MPNQVNTIISVLIETVQAAGLYITLNKSVSSGIVVGIASVLGGLLLGRTGITLGASVGGVVTAYFTRGGFQSVSSVIGNMSRVQQVLLVSQVLTTLTNMNITDLSNLRTLIQNVNEVRQAVFNTVKNFIHQMLNGDRQYDQYDEYDAEVRPLEFRNRDVQHYH